FKQKTILLGLYYIQGSAEAQKYYHITHKTTINQMVNHFSIKGQKLKSAKEIKEAFYSLEDV
ncbi:MAG: hypothetical protein ACRDCE_00180, partial [Cetobacterium sp.]|uniref:hypothetical protein n=1 Tax=Cetobacterium sp. TaxID=2071632 RepID=UPI003EE62BD1